jgi:hypothetical protein
LQQRISFVDVNAFADQVATTGFTANGFTVTAVVIGGGFSTDGVHPS